MPITPKEDGSRALALFAVQQGPLAGAKIAIPAPVVTIGQSSQNDVVLADDSVSRHHARLEYEAGSWLVSDLGSTNGTYLNGDRLPPNVPTPLPYGANIRFGAVLSRFRAAEGADLDAERARYAPPPPAAPLAARRRSGVRFPLWAFLLLLVVIAALVYLYLHRPAAPAVGMQPVAPILALLGPLPLST
jgi:pSer/pThr/pTyr-binding forkhead associated (FHA) protein